MEGQAQRLPDKEVKEVRIDEAIREAEKRGLCIVRKNTWWTGNFKIMPTDTPDCCLIIPREGQSDQARIGKRWNPCKEDLLADDWVATE